MTPLALYIHFPYCLYKCHYCDFNSYAVSFNENLEEPYLKALKREWEFHLNKLVPFTLTSIFLGGGTPSLFSPSGISQLLKMFNSFCDEKIEVTLECNPKTLDAQKIKDFISAGINRFSIGVQSFNDQYLSPLGRLHTGEEAKQTLSLFQSIKNLNWNFDLMFGFPGQTLEEVLDDLETAVNFHPNHLSFYELTLEPGTLFFQQEKQGKWRLPENSIQTEMYIEGVRFLESKGYRQYEISNFAQAEFESKHNLTYWNYEKYLGLGAGATSFLGEGMMSTPPTEINPLTYGYRWTSPKKPIDYLNWAGNPIPAESMELISSSTAQFEFLMMGLRLQKGISIDDFIQRFGEEAFYSYQPTISSLEKKEFLQKTTNSIYLTEKGRLMANEVLACFLKDV